MPRPGRPADHTKALRGRHDEGTIISHRLKGQDEQTLAGSGGDAVDSDVVQLETVLRVLRAVRLEAADRFLGAVEKLIARRTLLAIRRPKSELELLEGFTVSVLNTDSLGVSRLLDDRTVSSPEATRRAFGPATNSMDKSRPTRAFAIVPSAGGRGVMPCVRGDQGVRFERLVRRRGCVSNAA